MKKELSEKYKGCQITAIEELLKDENGKDYKFIKWSFSKKGDLVLSDCRTIDGDRLQSVNHAINDAKKNIDTLYRLLNDRKKYNKWVKRNPVEYKKRIDAHWDFHKELYRKVIAGTKGMVV